jgi:hypothetical protein
MLNALGELRKAVYVYLRAKVTLDHFVMVRIHARQPSSTGADLLAIYDLQKLNAKTAVIWLLSGFEVLLAPLTAHVRIRAHVLRLLSTSLNSQSPLESIPTGRSPSPAQAGANSEDLQGSCGSQRIFRFYGIPAGRFRHIGNPNQGQAAG